MPDFSDRHTLRLSGFDYRQAGAYFVTICTWSRKCLLGSVACDSVQLSPIGLTVEQAWRGLGRHFPSMSLDCLVVMPNHIHAIVLVSATGMRAKHSGPDASQRNLPHAECFAPTPQGMDQARGTTPASLGAVMQNVKSVSTRRVNGLRGTPGAHLWQRGYYDHVIRNEQDMARIREYILSNPAAWDTDEDNPAAIKRRG